MKIGVVSRDFIASGYMILLAFLFAFRVALNAKKGKSSIGDRTQVRSTFSDTRILVRSVCFL